MTAHSTSPRPSTANVDGGHGPDVQAIAHAQADTAHADWLRELTREQFGPAVKEWHDHRTDRGRLGAANARAAALRNTRHPQALRLIADAAGEAG